MNSQQMLDSLPAACAAIDDDGRLAWANTNWLSLFGLDAEGGSSAAVAELFPDEASVLDLLRGAVHGESPIRLQGRRRSGVPFTVAVAAGRDGSGTLVCVCRELIGNELVGESQQYLDVAFEIAPLGMALFDTEGRYLRVNAALCRMLRRAPQELIGRRDQEFTHPDDRQADVDAAWRILNGELDTWQTEKRFVSAAGDTIWAIANLTFLRDPDGRPLSWLGQFQDITERRQREELLGHIAVHDELTSVANRRGLYQELESRLAHARRYEEPGAVLVLDLDGFKEINDRQGHQAGDAVLVRVARALHTRLRTTDFIARLGGDEFAVILPHADAGAATIVAQALLATVRGLDSSDLRASCGIVLYDASTDGVESLLADADRAMYSAKAGGGDRVSVAQPSPLPEEP